MFQMRRFLFLSILLVSAKINAAPGDTIRIKTHENIFIETNPAVGFTDYTSWAVFPSVSRPIQKVLLELSFECPDGANCGEWDYLNFLYLRRKGGVNFPSEDIELARFITPYGNSFNSNWKASWALDITTFEGLLKDSVEIQYRHTGYEANDGDGWLINVAFTLLEGTPVFPFVKLHKLWNGNFGYGNSSNPINDQLEARTIVADNLTQSFRTHIVQSGHSFQTTENCAEFCAKYRTLRMDGQAFSEKLVWRDDCGLNPVFPQAGTWVYDRGGWCPGDLVYPDVNDITVLPGSTHSMEASMENYVNVAGGSPNYEIQSYLIEYGAPSFTLDASVEEILAPSDEFYFRRFNPVCGKPIVSIRNNGSTPLTTLLIDYGVKNGARSTFSWTGNLLLMETAEIELPANISWGATEGVFSVEVKNPNGGADEYAFNNSMESNYAAPLELPEIFVINVKSNTVGAETSWFIKDMNGNQVAGRDNFSNSTEYRDTVELAWGCYQFVLEDSDKDGLSWWANDDGDGFARIRRATSPSIIKTISPDFGTSAIISFTVGGLISTEDISHAINDVSLFPNPSEGSVRLSFNLTNEEEVSVSLYNTNGQEVLNHYFGKQKNVDQIIAVPDAPAGLYLLRVTAGEFSKTERLQIIR